MTQQEYRRVQYLPVALDAARRKVEALEREAVRYGLRDLVGVRHAD